MAIVKPQRPQSFKPKAKALFFRIGEGLQGDKAPTVPTYEQQVASGQIKTKQAGTTKPQPITPASQLAVQRLQPTEADRAKAVVKKQIDLQRKEVGEESELSGVAKVGKAITKFGVGAVGTLVKSADYFLDSLQQIRDVSKQRQPTFFQERPKIENPMVNRWENTKQSVRNFLGVGDRDKDYIDKLDAFYDNLRQDPSLQASEAWSKSIQKYGIYETARMRPLETLLELGPDVASSMVPFVIGGSARAGAFTLSVFGKKIPMLGPLLMGGTQANQLKQDAMATGVSEKQATLSSLPVAAAITALDSVFGIGKNITQIAKRRFGNQVIQLVEREASTLASRGVGAVKNSVEEGLTERLQEQLSILYERTYKDVSPEEAKTRKEIATFAGLAAGGAFDLLTNTISATTKRVAEEKLEEKEQPGALFAPAFKEKKVSDTQYQKDALRDFVTKNKNTLVDAVSQGKISMQEFTETQDFLEMKKPTDDIQRTIMETSKKAGLDFSDFIGIDKVETQEDPLIQEARKYKTVEEFVKSQGTPVYHGSDSASIIQKEGFKLGGTSERSVGASSNVDRLGKGIYFANDVKEASRYARSWDTKDVVESFIDSSVKIKKFDNYQDWYDFVKSKNPKAFEKPELLNKIFEKEGYGGVSLLGDTVIFDPKKVKTKSQLTDIWNKAQDEVAFKEKEFEGFTDLSTTILEKLKGRSTVSKQFISDLTNSPELKQAERDIIRQALETEGDTVDVKKFADKVKAELLPLERVSTIKSDEDFMGQAGRYENIALPDELRGAVYNYSENIYTSPIKTSAGGVHFSNAEGSENYFGHTRIEDMADDFVDGQPGTENTTRRVIEVQSDLYQKGGVEKDQTFSKHMGINTGEIYNEKIAKDFKRLKQYNDPTAHFRMIREEVKKAAQDGKTKLQFPTGETAVKIEGLGDTSDINNPWKSASLEKHLTDADGVKYSSYNNKLSEMKDDLYVGQPIKRSGEEWVITDVLGDGKFKAVPKQVSTSAVGMEAEGAKGVSGMVDFNDFSKTQQKQIAESLSETFDISGKVDTNNPIYKFYEKEVGRYLKNKYKAELVTDKQGVKWWEVKITEKMAQEPVTAFKRTIQDARSAVIDQQAGARRLQEYKDRLKLKFDVKLFDTILTGEIEDGKMGEAWGVTYENNIALAKSVTKWTADHEVVHYTYKNFDNIPLFESISKSKINQELRQKYGTELDAQQLEEKLAEDFELYMEDRLLEAQNKKPQHTFTSEVSKFFAKLWANLKEFFKGKPTEIESFYKTLAEGKSTQEQTAITRRSSAFAERGKILRFFGKGEQANQTVEEFEKSLQDEILRDYARTADLSFNDSEQEEGYQTYKYMAQRSSRVREAEDEAQLKAILKERPEYAQIGSIDNALFEGAKDGMTNDDLLDLFKERFEKEQELKTVAKQKVSKVKEPKETKPVTIVEEKKPVVIDPVLYEQNRQFEKGTGITQDAKNALKDFRKSADRILGAISTRLKNIDPSLKTKLRKFEFDIRQAQTKDVQAVTPMLEAVKKMSKEDKIDFDLARKNGDKQKIDELVSKYGMKKEYDQARNTLDELYKRSGEVGYDFGYKENYHPRVIKDTRGFIDYFRNSESWSSISEAIKNKENEVGRYLTEEEKAYLINTMIRGYGKGKIALSEIGNMKDRVIDVVTPELNQFYMKSDAALLKYIERANDAIETRKFFGKRAEGLVYDVNDSIGEFTLKLLEEGKITPEEEVTLVEILQARFNPRGVHGLLGVYKNLSYIDTMGSVTSAITQIGDLAWSLYRAGVIKTAKGFGRAIAGKSIITKKDLGIEAISEEFSDPTKLAKAVSKVFKLVGLEKMDTIGKETLVNTMIEKKQAQAKKGDTKLQAELDTIFGNEAEQVMEDLKQGKITENVKLLAFNTLLDFQPIALSEMPEQYIKGGQGRIFYMLKSFTLKQFDIYRNEVFQKLSKPETRVEGLKNLISLSAAFILMNATADEIKDLILGRKTSLKDRTVDNILRLMGFSKFIIYKARLEGIGSATVRQILPPFKFIDAAYKDIFGSRKDGLETVASIPIGGKLYYWWFGKGYEKENKKTKKKIKKPTRPGLSTRKKLTRPKRPTYSISK